MKIWIERALAGVRWVWEKLVAFAKVAFAKLQLIFNTVYDPPPKTIRFWFWSWAALMLVAWLTFAFVNSWFYKPTVELFATLGDDGDVFLPEPEPLPSVPTPAVVLPSVEVVCKDMSDTPQCEPVLPPETGNGGKVEVSDIQPPKSKKATHYKMKRVRKHQPYVTYWGY